MLGVTLAMVGDCESGTTTLNDLKLVLPDECFGAARVSLSGTSLPEVRHQTRI